MREIVFDTETTGLKPEDGERIIEIGAIELVNRFATGRTFHHYLNPEGRRVDPQAFNVHGISDEFLADKKTFAEIAAEWIEFTADAVLVAHNASFDVNFLNHEYRRLGIPPLDGGRIVDTLDLARRKHPMAANSLDKLCERYGIDNSRRTRHGALLDSELLSEVYVELLGGRQTSLELEVMKAQPVHAAEIPGQVAQKPERIRPLASRLAAADLERHRDFVAGLGEDAVWKRYAG